MCEEVLHLRCKSKNRTRANTNRWLSETPGRGFMAGREGTFKEAHAASLGLYGLGFRHSTLSIGVSNLGMRHSIESASIIDLISPP